MTHRLASAAPGGRLHALVICTLVVAWGSACSQGDTPWVSPMPFDTATVLVVSETDSATLLVEIASTEDQRAFGLSRRPSLDPGSGMLFDFDTIQAAEQGFWMWRTRIPLDIAYVGTDGVIERIVSMELCGDRAESCPSHPAGTEFAMALEANLGWFATHGMTEGDRVTVLR